MKKYTFLFFLTFSLFVLSQEVDLYNKAISCYNSGDFNCSKKEFSKLKSSSNYSVQANAYFYLAMSAAKSYDSNTIYLFEIFIELFPESEKYDDAVTELSSYLIKKRNYDLVIKCLNKENLDLFSFQNSSRSLFNRAYSNYMLGKTELAAHDFLRILNQKKSFVSDDATFYYACLLLDIGDLDGALSYFNTIKETDAYQKKIPYYIAHIMFLKKEYVYLKSYLSNFITDPAVYNYDEIVLINAKTYFQLKDYQACIPFFEEYKNSANEFSEIQYYELGYSYYKIGFFNEAIENFNKIIDLENSVSQYAYYYLAYSYLAVGQKIESANAFKSSFDRAQILESEHNDHSSEQLAENAYYNFALLCYESENSLYNSIDVFNDFIVKYPDSEKLSEIYSYLSILYLSTSDYDNAIFVLEKNIQKEGVKAKIQSVAYYRGVQLFNDQEYDKAILCFQKSISYPISKELQAYAFFWSAEAFFLKNEYNKSINILNDLLLLDFDGQIKNEALYTLGYSHNYLNNYELSNNFFHRILSNKIDASMNLDSLLTFSSTSIDIDVLKNDLKGFEDILQILGDNYFHLSNYDLAIKYYNLSYLCDHPKADYSLFKMGVCFGLINDYESRMSAFNILIDQYINSEFFDEAMFELGITYMLMDDYILAQDIFEQIITNNILSIYFFDAKLKLAICYEKLGQNMMAIKELKDVVEDSSSSNLFKRDALYMLESIYESLYKIDDFMIYAQSIPNYDFDKMALDSSMYYAAESEYISKNYLTAEKKFKHYLENFSNGLFFNDSKYYLSKSLIELSKNDEAIKELESILDQNNNQFTLKSIYLLADLYFEKGNLLLSKEKYDLLIQKTSDLDYIKEANLKLCEINFELNNYQNVIDQALLIEKELILSDQDKLDLYYWLGVSYFSIDFFDEAIKTFEWIINNSSGENQARSLFYMAKVYYNLKNYDASKNYIFELANNLPSYTFWVSRGILLLAKNYLAEEDFFQANHILEEFVNKYNDVELIEEAQQLLNSINYE